MEDGLTFTAQQFATCTSDHGAIPPGVGRVPTTAIFRVGRHGHEVIARVSASLSDTPILRDSRRKTRGAPSRRRSAHVATSSRNEPDSEQDSGCLDSRWILVHVATSSRNEQDSGCLDSRLKRAGFRVSGFSGFSLRC
jgi:hypothetical protein